MAQKALPGGPSISIPFVECIPNLSVSFVDCISWFSVAFVIYISSFGVLFVNTFPGLVYPGVENIPSFNGLIPYASPAIESSLLNESPYWVSPLLSASPPYMPLSLNTYRVLVYPFIIASPYLVSPLLNVSFVFPWLNTSLACCWIFPLLHVPGLGLVIWIANVCFPKYMGPEKWKRATSHFPSSLQ